MKRYLSLLLLLALTACAPASKGEVVVFAAASLEATLTQIMEQYEAENPNLTLTCTFDSSGTLRTQIKEGAACDLFLSAGQKQMDDLENDFVVPGSRIDLLENKVVLAVPAENPAGIHSYQDLANSKLLCIGNEDVPVGGYSLEILSSLGIDIAQLEEAGAVTYASNVTEVARQIQESAVDCGIIYATDAFTHQLSIADEAGSDLCGQVIYPAAVINSGQQPQAAQDFLDYLRTNQEARSILEGVGFTVLP